MFHHKLCLQSPRWRKGEKEDEKVNNLKNQKIKILLLNKKKENKLDDVVTTLVANGLFSDLHYVIFHDPKINCPDFSDGNWQKYFGE